MGCGQEEDGCYGGEAAGFGLFAEEEAGQGAYGEGDEGAEEDVPGEGDVGDLEEVGFALGGVGEAGGGWGEP
jgi:hypothetical protein